MKPKAILTLAISDSNTKTFPYNGDNQLISRTAGGATITYKYDGKGNLVKKASTDGTWTVYIGGVYELNSDGSYVTYYSAFGRRIAMRDHSGPSDPGTVYFLLADQLGSTSTVLDASGAVVESAKYYPYGSVRSSGVTVTDKRFTGRWANCVPFPTFDSAHVHTSRHHVPSHRGGGSVRSLLGGSAPRQRPDLAQRLSQDIGLSRRSG